MLPAFARLLVWSTSRLTTRVIDCTCSSSNSLSVKMSLKIKDCRVVPRLCGGQSFAEQSSSCSDLRMPGEMLDLASFG